MHFLCPICKKGTFTLQGEKCSRCGTEPTIQNIGKQFLREIWCIATGDILVPCLCCGGGTRLSRPHCAHCERKLPYHTSEPIKRRLSALGLTGDPKAQRKRERWYLSFSSVALCILLRAVSHRLDLRPEEVAVSITYVVFFIAIAAFLIPRERFIAVFSGAPPIVNFRRCLNLFSVMVIMQAGIRIWWNESSFLAIQMGLLWGAGFVFFALVLPILLGFRDLFVPRPVPFSPAAPQGRDAFTDIK